MPLLWLVRGGCLCSIFRSEYAKKSPLSYQSVSEKKRGVRMKQNHISITQRCGRVSSVVLCCLLAMMALAACANKTPATTTTQGSGIHKIKHIIVIMQENRSFDSYFGTYPGVDGIPMVNGVPTVCVNVPVTGQCVKPYHDSQDLNHGGPHGALNATADIDNGKMDGFIAQA